MKMYADFKEKKFYSSLEMEFRKEKKRIFMEKKKLFVQSIYAGFMIGIGGIVNLSMENKVLGSLFFSFGLLTIVAQGFFLYTGKIGFVKKFEELWDMLFIVIGNSIGTFLAAWLANAAELPIDSTDMVKGKLDHTLLQVFLLSVFCGVLMYLAINNYNKTRNIIFIIAPVMIFILSGFEHSIANMFYFHLAGIYSWKSMGYLLVMVIGNGIGAKIFSWKED